jgi:glutamine synthetase
MRDLSPAPSTEELVGTCRELVDSRALEWVIIAGPDLNGILRGKSVAADRFAADPEAPLPVSDLVFALDPRGEVVTRPSGFEGWWPSGDTTGHEDILLVPDLQTFRALPWSEGTGIVLAEYRKVDGTPVVEAPTHVLGGVVERAAGLGLAPQMAAELEFFCFDAPDSTTERPEPAVASAEGYLSVSPGDDELLMRSVGAHLSAIGVESIAQEREGGPGQYEISIRHSPLPKAANDATMLKYAIKAVARIHGSRATFMSKPVDGLFGSGCHLHQSLLSSETGENLFFDEAGEDRLSDVARSFIAGQLATQAEFGCIWASTPNAYKRILPFVGGTVAWAFGNRAAALRVTGGDGGTFRIEHRVAGGEANVYLAMAAALAGGLHGIEKGLEPPPPSSGDFFEKPGNETIPSNLEAAIERFEASEIAREYLGEEFVRLYAGSRRWEVQQERAYVTTQELERYSGPL